MKKKLEDVFGPIPVSPIMTIMKDWKQNLDWLQVSQKIALDIIDHLHTKKVDNTDFAKSIGVDTFILSEMMRGDYNFTIKEIADIKRAIN